MFPLTSTNENKISNHNKKFYAPCNCLQKKWLFVIWFCQNLLYELLNHLTVQVAKKKPPTVMHVVMFLLYATFSFVWQGLDWKGHFSRVTICILYPLLIECEVLSWWETWKPSLHCWLKQQGDKWKQRTRSTLDAWCGVVLQHAINKRNKFFI